MKKKVVKKANKRLPPKLPSGERMTPNKVYKSSNPKKKKMVYAIKEGKGKLIHFGQKGYSDFTKHKSNKRRDSFNARFGGIKDKKGNSVIKDRHSAAYWSKKVLWSMWPIIFCGILNTSII